MSDDSDQLQDMQIFRESPNGLGAPPNGLGAPVVEVYFAIVRGVANLAPRRLTLCIFKLEDRPEAEAMRLQDLASLRTLRHVSGVTIPGLRQVKALLGQMNVWPSQWQDLT